MTALGLASRFLRSRAVASALGIVSIALAVGIIVGLRTLPRAIGRGTVEPAVRIPVVVGRSASASRLVLSAVFLEPPAPESLERSLTDAVRGGPGVAEALPLRIEHRDVGTIVFTARAYFRLGQGRMRLARGRFFEDSEEGKAVAGSRVAKKTGADLGKTVLVSDARLTVVGILEATGTPLDDAMFVPLPPDGQPVSIIVVVPRAGFDPAELELLLAESARGIRVVPVEPALRRLVALVGAVEGILGWLSWALAALVAMLVLSSFYSSVRERLKDLAVLRVIGARRSTVVFVLLWEAAIIGALGGVLGLLAAEALLAAASGALASAGFAFSPEVGPEGLRVAGVGMLTTGAAGLFVARAAYRMDPTYALAGVDRPWPEVLGGKGRASLRRLVLAVLIFIVAILPGAMYRSSPSRRLLSQGSMRVFNALAKWDGDDAMPSEIAALDGKAIEVEGYQYVPFEPGGSLHRWCSMFFLVAVDPNRPVEPFHDDEHRPDVNERIAVDLVEPVERTLYPVRVTGTLEVRPGRAPVGDAFYRIVGARAKVLTLESD